jgi:hypothetical protein
MTLRNDAISTSLLPCQIWARRCLDVHVQALACDLRRLLRARTAARGALATGPAGTGHEVIAAVTDRMSLLQSTLARWRDDYYAECGTCTKPVDLSNRGNVAHCQALGPYLID